ncbi:MAG: esterase-like activity of phytase family protein [Albidovulum sp.]
MAKRVVKFEALALLALLAVFLGYRWLIMAENGPSARLHQIAWEDPSEEFGGISGLDVIENGLGLWVVSDRGRLFRASLTRDDMDQVSGIQITERYHLLDDFGREVSGFSSDSEAVRVLDDGRVVISFEGLTRVAYFSPPSMVEHLLNDWMRFETLWGNKGMEALAISSTGQITTLLEKPAANKGYVSFVYHGDDKWEEGPYLATDGRFMATDADFGPDGRLYVLERRFSYVWGYSTRISVYSPLDEGYSMPEVVLETAPGSYSDFEGLSLWTDAKGRLIATLVSDNNFLPFSSTMLAEFALDP